MIIWKENKCLEDWGEIIGKILLVSFEGDEEKLIDSVISVLDAGREKFTF